MIERGDHTGVIQILQLGHQRFQLQLLTAAQCGLSVDGIQARADESIVIQPAEGADGAMTLAQLFANGPIQITLLGGTGRRVKMGIEAPEQLAIRRKDID